MCSEQVQKVQKNGDFVQENVPRQGSRQRAVVFGEHRGSSLLREESSRDFVPIELQSGLPGHSGLEVPEKIVETDRSESHSTRSLRVPSHMLLSGKN